MATAGRQVTKQSQQHTAAPAELAPARESAAVVHADADEPVELPQEGSSARRAASTLPSRTSTWHSGAQPRRAVR